MQLQPNYGPGGPDDTFESTSLAVQGGQIYVAGSILNVYDDFGEGGPSVLAVARLDINGNLDASYGGAAPAPPPDQKIFYNSLATPGWAFAVEPGVGDSFAPMLVQSDGQALLSVNSSLYQFSADGRTLALVPNSGSSNMITQPDGKLLAAAISYDPTNGYSLILTRLNPDLTPDTTFGPAGEVQAILNVSLDPSIIPGISSVFLQSDGNVVVAMDLNDIENNNYIGTVGSIITRVLGKAAPGQTVHEGDTVTLTGTATDPGAADVPTLAYAWSVTKDGAAYQTATGTTYQFNPSDSGTYVVTLTVTDKDGGTSSTSDAFLVQDAPPTSVQIVNPSITSSGQVSFSANMTGPSTGDQAADGYTINWGDGTAATNVAATANNGNGSLVLPSHTYAAPGLYTITLTASEDAAKANRRRPWSYTVQRPTTASRSRVEAQCRPGGRYHQRRGQFHDDQRPDKSWLPIPEGNDTYTVNFGSNLTTPITLAGSGRTA